MEVRDNIMTILKSITPIRYKFSKENRQFDNAFKTRSLQSLIKSIDYHPKLKDEFAPSPEFMNNKNNKYEINFKNSDEYIKELSDLNNLPLIVNNKNCLKNGKFNDDFDISPLSNKEEKKKIMEEKERRKRERLEERLKKLKLWRESDSNTDSLKYNPNYELKKKKIFSVHIRPPTLKKIKIQKEENEKNADKKKNKLGINNNLNKSQNQNNGTQNPNNSIQTQNLNPNQNQSEITFDKNKNEADNNINITINHINNQNNKEIRIHSINNNSLINNDSRSNRSNSSKLKFQENNYFSSKSVSRNILKPREKVLNLKNRIKVYEKNSSTNSDYNTMEINKSTNIEDISIIHQEKEKFNSIHSMRNIINRNNNVYLPKITKKIKKSLRSRTNRNNGIKNSFYFKKMLGRKSDIFVGEQSKNAIAYFPNYDFFRPHIPTTTFKYKKNDVDYKKYITGKIIRGYNYSSEKYFVFEYKIKKPKKLNLNRERIKIIEILKKKVE